MPQQAVRDLARLVTEARQRVRKRAAEQLQASFEGVLDESPVLSPPATIRGAPDSGGRAADDLAPSPRAGGLPRQWVAAVRTPPRPPRKRELVFADGRRVRVRTAPAVADWGEVARAERISTMNERETFVALNDHEARLVELERAKDDLLAKLAELEERVDLQALGLWRDLGGLKARIEGVSVLGDQVARKVDRATADLSARQTTLLSRVRAQALGATAQKLSAVATSMQVAAYGQPGSLASVNNVLLAGNQLLWGFADSLLRWIGLANALSPQDLTWLAPLGSLVTGGLILGRRQSVRFVSGIVSFPPKQTRALIPLEGRIAPALWPSFRVRTDVSVAVTPLDSFADRVVLAAVRQGILVIGLDRAGGLAAEPDSTRFGWMVDTAVPGG